MYHLTMCIGDEPAREYPAEGAIEAFEQLKKLIDINSQIAVITDGDHEIRLYKDGQLRKKITITSQTI